MPIYQADLDHNFPREVAAHPDTAHLWRCFDCGSCAGVCPVSEACPEFDPRKILHQIRLGLKKRLLTSPGLWYCTHCDTCAFACPQEVPFSRIIDALRGLALAQGYVSPGRWQQWGAGPCKAACPAGISIPGFLTAIREGRYEEGLRLIKRDLPFPGICGRVCPHPCEAACQRGQLDEPLAIMSLKRFLADAVQDAAVKTAGSSCFLSDSHFVTLSGWGEGQGLTPPGPSSQQQSSRRPIAVIGAGPAGLTAAYYLALAGHLVTIYEKLPVAGGMMAVGIPAFRLPRDILAKEIADIESLGVEIRLHCEVGRNVSFAQLREKNDAVFVSIGLHQARQLGLPGEEELAGVMDGITFLREVNLGRPPAFAGRVAVIGGGNVALDCARTARRLSSAPVTIVYRRSRAEMPAYHEEVEAALQEGIDFLFLTAPLALEGKNGKVQGLTCQRLELGEADASGRRRPVPLTGSEFFFPAEAVIPAIGQTADLGVLNSLTGLEISPQHLLAADPVTCATALPGVFAGGDIVSGPYTVVAAVATGKEAAASIHRYLTGQDLRHGRPGPWQAIPYTPRHPLSPQPRETMPQLPLPQRVTTFKEVALGFSEDQAHREAARCLRLCGLQTARR